MNQLEIRQLADYCERVLDLSCAKLGDEYYYQSLPLCVIDAVYSVGAKYEGTQRTVVDYCKYFGLRRIRPNRTGNPPPVEHQQSVEQFLQTMVKYSIKRITEEIFNNRQRTSTISGILKSEAVIRFAEVLKRYNIDYFQDVPKVITNEGFKREILSIPGQTRNVSLNYFFMLSGSDDFIKADRMIIDFVKDGANRISDAKEALSMLTQTYHHILKPKYHNLTPRLLDHVIWSHQRQKRGRM